MITQPFKNEKFAWELAASGEVLGGTAEFLVFWADCFRLSQGTIAMQANTDFASGFGF